MATKTDDDLFQDTTMTFGEHLDDLRKCLFKAVIALTIGTCVGFYYGTDVVHIIERPLEKALGTYYIDKSLDNFDEWLAKRKQGGLPEYYDPKQVKKFVIDTNMTFEIRLVHPYQALNELHRDTSKSTSTPLPEASGSTKPPAIPPPDTAPPKSPAAQTPVGESTDGTPKKVPLKPEDLALTNLVPIMLWQPLDTDSRTSLKAMNAQEAFSIWLKASLVVGLILSSPFVFYYIWSFVAAGLYPHEKRYVHVFLPFSLGLFLLGAATAYIFVFEPVLSFLFGFNKSLGIEIDPRINEWMSFVLLLPLGFGVGFQLPLVMLFLERLGIFDIQVYREKWRISVLVIFILSAILTPADPYSLLLMACPLTVLYFCGILLCKWLPRRGDDLAKAA